MEKVYQGKKIILFARNAQVQEEVLNQIDKNIVAGVFNFENLENAPSNDVPNFSSDALKQYEGGGYKIIIAINAGRSKDDSELGQSFFYRLSLAVAKLAKQSGIDFIFWPPFSHTLHLRGIFPNLSYEPCHKQVLPRANHSLSLINEVFRTFNKEFVGKNIDLWIFLGDQPERALSLAEALDLPFVFAYCTTYSMNHRVIAFPDYHSFYTEDEKHAFSPYILPPPSECKKAAAKPWQDNHIFWRGSLFTSFSRECLYALGKRYPEYLRIEDGTKGQFLPMIEQAKYKYLIDTRGHGWSIRLQTFLQLGRPIFLVDRPYREWYFDRMTSWKHYIPVKEDLSDLIEKYEYMERHPEVYADIVHNMRVFVEENLTPNRILNDMKNLILKYGIVNQ